MQIMGRRWRVLTATFALLSITIGAWYISRAFHLIATVPEGLRQGLMEELLVCGSAEIIVSVILLSALVLYAIYKRAVGMDLVFISVFLLLILNGAVMSALAKYIPSVDILTSAVGLYSYILAPLALMLVVCSKPEKSTGTIWLTAICVSLSALMPMALVSTIMESMWLCYEVATISLIVVLVACSLKSYSRVKPNNTYGIIGLAVGLTLLSLSLIIGAVWYLIYRQDAGLAIWGILALLAGVIFDTVRPILKIDKQYRDFEDLRKREEEYRFASRHISMYIIRYRVAEGHMSFRGDTSNIFGVPSEMDNMPQALLDMGKVVESSVQSYNELYHKIRRGDPKGSGIFGVYNKNGAPIWLHTDFTTNFDEYGAPVESIISSYEIVGMREKEAAYERWRKQYHESSLSEGSTYYELNLTRGELRAGEGTLLPEPPQEARRDMDSLVSYITDNCIIEEDRPAVCALLDRSRLLGCYEQDIRRESQECHRISGDNRLWTMVAVRMVSDPHSNEVLGFVMFMDIEEQKRKEAREKTRSMTDGLTGLLSRVSFEERFNELCAASGKDACHAVIMIDLDGFKAVNDTFGHRFGDKVLIDVANDLRAINRSDDLIARMGGDEYIICIKNIPQGTALLESRCRAISRALSKQYGDTVAISGSLGVAVYPKDGADFDELYQHADQAQYSAKQQGRNRYVLYSDEKKNLTEPTVAPVDESAPEQMPSKRRAAEAEQQRKPSEHRHTLLVVDDQRINRVLLREIFKDIYDVLEATNGREALEILRNPQQTISAIVLDLMMPEVSGLDVLREMNEDVYYQSIPVIVISSADEDEFGIKALELGAVDFVNKPIDERLVRLRVRNAIFRRESEDLRAQNRDLLVQRADETRHQNQLRYLADHDTLTHICNKTAFYRKTHDMIEKDAETRYCIVSFDVQRFRAVNDIFGHDEGDRLLRYIAMQLRNLIGHDGTYTRADTDNFAFCVSYDREKVEGYISGILNALSEYDLTFEVQLSFGIYVIENPELPVNQMYDRSEMAKRTVKGSYVKRWAYYDDNMREMLLEEQEIVSSMNAALEDGEFIVYYQPKCLLDTGMIVGAEALVRWNHKTRGLLNPGVFVPIFEKNGFIMKIDIYMWEQVCKFLSKRLKADPNDRLHVSVNISRANLYNPNLSRTLDELCKRYGVPNDRMEVEITESAYVENAHLLRGLTDDLHRLGFTVEMDDFGSGYSSLNMLKEIPVDVLKLDMRFLYGIQNDNRGGSILNSTVSMAHQLHLQVIAEGVESEEQARFLAAIGCKLAQGFYYAKPMPEADFVRRYDSQPSIDEAVRGGLQGANEQIDRLLCSAAMCRQTAGDIRLINVNEYYLRMMRINRENFDESDSLLSNWTGMQDIKTLRDCMNRSRETGEVGECVYLQRDLSDKHHLLKASVRFLLSEGGSNYYLMTFNDISGDKE